MLLHEIGWMIFERQTDRFDLQGEGFLRLQWRERSQDYPEDVSFGDYLVI
jgi:hypothetical protein